MRGTDVDTRLSGLDLFSGIGGISAALKPWTRPVAYCERDTYCQAQLLSRMQTGDLDRAPIWDDITTLRTDMLPPVEIVYGGFPCQNISAAGAGAGLAGESSRLYFELERIVAAARPAFVFLENVPAIRTRGLGRVVWGLSALGYDLRWTVISAAAVGAPRQRDRWFCLAANPDRIEQWNESGRIRGSSGQGPAVTRNDGSSKPVADTASKRFGEARRLRPDESKEWIASCSEALANPAGFGLEEPFVRREPKESRKLDVVADAGWWKTEPDMGRVVDGLPFRVDRIRGLGNSVVPLQARRAFEILAGLT